MLNEDVQVTDKTVGQIWTQQQQTLSTPAVFMCRAFQDTRRSALLPRERTLSCARVCRFDLWAEYNGPAHTTGYLKTVRVCVQACAFTFQPRSSLAWISH